MRIFFLLLLLLAITGAGLSAQERTRPARQPSIWISRQEVRALPDWGPEWDRVLLDANRPFVPNIENKEDRTDAWVLAASLVWVRSGAPQYRERVREACAFVTQAVPPAENDPPNDRTQAWARNLTGYILAADLVGLDVALDTLFRARLRAALPHLRRVHRTRPNNIGTHAGAARVAIAL